MMGKQISFAKQENNQKEIDSSVERLTAELPVLTAELPVRGPQQYLLQTGNNKAGSLLISYPPLAAGHQC